MALVVVVSRYIRKPRAKRHEPHIHVSGFLVVLFRDQVLGVVRNKVVVYHRAWARAGDDDT